MGGDVAAHGLGGQGQAVFLHGQHLDELAPAREQRLQCLGFGVFERAHRGLKCCAQLREHPDVEPIGLGEDLLP